ncbi:MAG: rhodanese-like domain-containing protein [Roseovarius sp.]
MTDELVENTRLASQKAVVSGTSQRMAAPQNHVRYTENFALSVRWERLVPNLDPDADIVAYCRGLYSIFAHQAVAALRKHDLNAWRLEGGLPEWRAKGGRKAATV